MFEDRTYENILNEALADAPPNISLRKGDIYYDAIVSNCKEIAKFYTSIKHAFDLVFLTTAVDEYLDQKGSEYGVYRNLATSSRYEFIYKGSRPSAGERFFVENKYFMLTEEGSDLFLEAEETGQNSNNIFSDTAAIPLNNITGLSASAFGELIEPGTDAEEDEDYRQRIREKIAGPAENGNRQHYKTWCESVAGVKRARIIPLANGPNTVTGVLYGTDGCPATPALVERVQEFIDPGGTGLGEGKANLGAHFTAEAAHEHGISIEFHATFSSDTIKEKAKEEASEAIAAYFKEIALKTPEDEKMIIRVSAIGTFIYNLPSIIDYTSLKLNGESANIELIDTESPVLKEVIIIETLR